MARKITDVQNTDGITAVYPSGSMRDKAGATSGTILEEELIGDMTQFFAKLMRDTSTVVNSLPDNETNGYQMFTAFVNHVRSLDATTSAKGVVEKATPTEAANGDADKYIDAALLQSTPLQIGAWQNPSYNANFSAGTDPFQFRLNKGRLEFRGNITAAVTSGTAFALPLAYRPIIDVNIPASDGSSIIQMEVNTNGSVGGLNWAIGDNTFNNVIIID